MTCTASLGDGQWIFTWTTGQYGRRNRTQCGWVLDGRPNATPETDWVVAHDIFHHEPEDTGTYREEVMTFGAETWMAEPGTSDEDLTDKLGDSWHGVMVLVLENGTRGATGLLLKAPGGELADAIQDHPMGRVWANAYRMALDGVRSTHGELAEPSLWDLLGSHENVVAAVSLMAQGYRLAQGRWPDVDRAREMFAQVEDAAGPANDGDRLDVRIQRGRIQIHKTQAPGVVRGRSPGR